MSQAKPLFIVPSPEFIALCHSQVALLIQGMKADWTVVYLTEGLLNEPPTNLIPVVVYPQNEEGLNRSVVLHKLPKVWGSEAIIPLLSSDISDKSVQMDYPTTDWPAASFPSQNQMILPLIYKDVMLGLLVIGRRVGKWHNHDLTQFERIAKTIALARFMDQRQGWYEQQLNEEHIRQQLEHEGISNLLHQLRNPLTALRTFSKLLLKRLLPEDKNQATAKGILRETDRLSDLLEEFETDIDSLIGETSEVMMNTPLMLPQVASSGLLLPGATLPLESLEVRDILEPLILSSAAIARERELELTVYLPPNLPPVTGNKKALREVFSNLLDNALKYTPAGGKVDISIDLDLSGGRQGVVIRDTGVGIPPQDRENIFVRHYRGVQSQGNIPGTGLGLAIAKELVEQMGGKIELISPNYWSQTAPGTTFIVWLVIQLTINN